MNVGVDSARRVDGASTFVRPLEQDVEAAEIACQIVAKARRREERRPAHQAQARRLALLRRAEAGLEAILALARGGSEPTPSKHQP